jgi:hypothetical protein
MGVAIEEIYFIAWITTHARDDDRWSILTTKDLTHVAHDHDYIYANKKVQTPDN